MPFQVCTREAGSIIEHESYDDINAADVAVKILKESGKITFLRQVTNDTSWHLRELSRIMDGTYTKLPWHYEEWHSPHIKLFAHVSIQDNARIAYTASNAHGAADRQTRIKVGRYLEMVGCPNVNYWVSEFNKLYSNVEVKFATTADDFEHVYTNGPSSCMSKPARYYESRCHPVRVYATGELHLAYLEVDDDITARALVRPSKMVHCRIYGDESRLSTALTKLGYKEDWDSTLEGVKLTRIESNDGFVMPYLDAICAAEDHGSYIKITSEGDIDCNSTNGIAADQNSHECYHCGCRVDDDDGYCDDDGDYWCNDCHSNYHNICVSCDRTVHVDSGYGTTLINGDFYCERCTRRELTDCHDCREYFLNDYVYLSEHDDEYRCESCNDEHEEQFDDNDDDGIIDYNNDPDFVAEFDNMIGLPLPAKVYGLPNVYTDSYYDIEFVWEKVFDAAMQDNREHDAAYFAMIRATVPMLPFVGIAA